MIAGWDVPHFHYHLIPMFDYFDLDPKRGKERTSNENLKMQTDLEIEIGRLLAVK